MIRLRQHAGHCQRVCVQVTDVRCVCASKRNDPRLCPSADWPCGYRRQLTKGPVFHEWIVCSHVGSLLLVLVHPPSMSHLSKIRTPSNS